LLFDDARVVVEVTGLDDSAGGVRDLDHAAAEGVVGVLSDDLEIGLRTTCVSRFSPS